MTKTMVDKELRNQIFEMLFCNDETSGSFVKINDRQYGIILIDANGEQRYVRVGAIVAELRDDVTPQELMLAEIEEYEMKQKAKAEKAKAKETKIAKDKARREKEKAEVSAS